MQVLLHICCAACAIGPLEELRREGHRVTGLFYNPNIHPLIEFRRRTKALKVFHERLPLPVLYEEAYGLEEYLKNVDWSSGRRCEDCYRLRLRRTAREAADRGMDAFTTTLLTSVHQKHDMVARVGRSCADERGVEFLYRDWRALAGENRRRAGELRLYLQQYCGCIFSEYERFRDTKKHVYRGPGPAPT